MSQVRIALANIRPAATREESVELAKDAIAEASRQEAAIICFPEAYIPGYRAFGPLATLPDAAFLKSAWASIAAAAGKAGVGVILGTERVTDQGLLLSALVIRRDGSIDGFQNKVQLDPLEDAIYTAGAERRVFQAGPLTFGIAICHEGFRYPETVRWAARRGAQVVFHPHYHPPEPGAYVPHEYGDPRNSFHEKAALCRAAENTCYYATVNCAVPGSPTTSAIVRPDGTVLAWQPYGQEGLLVADLDLTAATGLLASRYKPE